MLAKVGKIQENSGKFKKIYENQRKIEYCDSKQGMLFFKKLCKEWKNCGKLCKKYQVTE